MENLREREVKQLLQGLQLCVQSEGWNSWVRTPSSGLAILPLTLGL